VTIGLPAQILEYCSTGLLSRESCPTGRPAYSPLHVAAESGQRRIIASGGRRIKRPGWDGETLHFRTGPPIIATAACTATDGVNMAGVWHDLHFLFDTDDGSLPVVRVTGLARSWTTPAASA
jgi:hypothetical protein